MLWATVSSRSCFCWLYRASPSLAARNIINLISVLTILLMYMFRITSCIAGKGYLLWPVCSLDKTLLAFALLHFVLQGQTSLLFQVSLAFLLLHSNVLWWKECLFESYFSKKVLEVFIEPFNFSFLGISGWGTDLDYYDIEWFAGKRTKIMLSLFEIAPKYYILDFCWLWGLLHFF